MSADYATTTQINKISASAEEALTGCTRRNTSRGEVHHCRQQSDWRALSYILDLFLFLLAWSAHRSLYTVCAVIAKPKITSYFCN